METVPITQICPIYNISIKIYMTKVFLNLFKISTLSNLDRKFRWIYILNDVSSGSQEHMYQMTPFFFIKRRTLYFELPIQLE